MDGRFRHRVKALREDAQLTQKELGLRLGGLSDSTINNYESGKRHPEYDTLIKIANVFGVTTDYLVGKDNTWAYSLPEDLREFVLDPENEVYLGLSREIKNAEVLPSTVKAFIEALVKDAKKRTDSTK